MRKVAFLCDWHTQGGPVTFIRRLCPALSEFGWSPKVILAPSPWPCKFDLGEKNLPAEVVPWSYSFGQLGNHFARAIASFAPDVVVGFAIRGAPLAMRRLYRRGSCSARFLDTIQSDLASEYRRARSNSDFLAALGAVSEGAVQRARSEIPEIRDRVFRIHCPVPCADTPPAVRVEGGPIRLAYLGIVRHHEKRVLDLIPLASELLTRSVDFELTIIGGGSERAQLERELSALPGATQRIHFTGMLPNPQALEVLSRQHVLLLLSEVEGQPIALLEAMALRLVPVVTDLPALREVVVHGENGFLAPVAATAAFASHIATLAAHPELREQITLANWRHVRENHEIRNAVRRFAELLETVRTMPLPNPQRLAKDSYPDNAMTRWRVPQSLQAVKRRCMGQVVF
ncbi:MAG: glycosyltransferase family 4 protein [Terriglobales bacterium]